MKKNSFAVIGISAALFIFVAFAFTPAIFPAASATGCTVNWSNPTGTFSPGQSISSSATTSGCAAGTGTYSVCTTPIASCILGVGVVQTGSFSCTSLGVCSTLVTDTASAAAGVTCTNTHSCNLGPGTYSYVASFLGTSTQQSFTASITVVTPQFPAGMILAVLAPVAALIGYAKFRKPAFPKYA